MPDLYQKISSLKSILTKASSYIRELPPPVDPETLREREALTQRALIEAAAAYEEILSANDRAKNPLPENVIARISYTVINLFTRGGFFAEAKKYYKAMESYTLPESRAAKYLTVVSLVFCCLTHFDFDEAKRCFSLFSCDDPDPDLVRHKAGCAYYYAFEILRAGRDPEEAQDLYEHIKSFKDKTDFLVTRFVERVPIKKNGGGGEGEGESNVYFLDEDRASENGRVGFDPVRDFPLALEADNYNIMAFDLPADLPKVGPGDTTADIMAAFSLFFMVYFGSSGDLSQARKYFKEISLWPGLQAEKLLAMAGVFMTHYIGLVDPLEAKVFYEGLFERDEDELAESLNTPGAPPLPPTLGDKYPALAAQGAINLIESLDAPENIDLATEVFRKLSDNPAYKEDPLLISRAALNFIGVLIQRNRLSEAKDVYDSLPLWWDNLELRTVRGKAAIDLIYYLGLKDSPDKAREIYENLLAWGKGQDLSAIKGRAGAVLISIYEAKGNLSAASEIFWAMETGKGSNAAELERAHAAHSIIRMYGKAKDPQNALKVFRALGEFGDNEEMDRQRAGAAINLILILGKAKRVKIARAIYSRMPPWGVSPELDYLRAKAAVNLISVFEESKDAKKAQALYDSMVFWNTPLALEKAKAAVTLLGIYGQLGDPAKATTVFESLPRVDHDLEYDMVRQSAVINLITAHAMNENWREALEILSGDLGASLDNIKRDELIKRLDYIMSLGGNFGKKDRLSIISLFTDMIKNPMMAM
jgi:tetratricopeptide (TPR) repeat protein